MHSGEILDSRFKITHAVIAEGGASVVHRARDLTTREDVAVKVLDPMVDVARLAQEIHILGMLNEPRIAGYIAHGTTKDGCRYLAMPWVEGPTLAQYQMVIGLTIAEALATSQHIALAMETAHQLGVVHRDLKPANIVLEHGAPTAPIILDFGIAASMGGRRLTKTGTVLGTPSYMSPEQARGESDIDRRCDIFALGCILYEAVTGLRAFSGSSDLAVRTKTLLVAPTPAQVCNDQVSDRLSELIMSMLAKRPSNRPETMKEVARLLATHTEVAGGTRLRSKFVDESKADVGGTIQLGDSDDAIALVLAVSANTGDDQDANETHERVAAIYRQLGGNVRPLVGRSVLGWFSGRDAEIRAARAALAVARAHGELELGLAVPPTSAPGDVIDRCAQAVSAELRRSIGVQHRPRVRVLEPISDALSKTFELHREGRRVFLEEAGE